MRVPIAIILLVTGWLPGGLKADVPLGENTGLAAYGDTTLRFEVERGSEVGRPDRTRLRITQHLGLRWLPMENVEVNGRLRTGTIENQHTPTVTLLRFDNNPVPDPDVFADRYFLRLDPGNTDITAGRMAFPYWFVTDYFWDRDIDPTGLALAHVWQSGEDSFLARASYFRLPDGSIDLHGDLWSAQIEYRKEQPHGQYRFLFSAHRFGGRLNPRYLQQGGGERDYFVLVATVRYARELAGKPAWLGADLIHNVEDYGDVSGDSIAAAFGEDRSGFGLGLSWGENRERGDWRLRYNYAYIEKLAVNRSYAQDTISRFDKSNIRGHDFRVIYSLASSLTVMARLSLSEQIVGPEEGLRFRIDAKFIF